MGCICGSSAIQEKNPPKRKAKPENSIPQDRNPQNNQEARVNIVQEENRQHNAVNQRTHNRNQNISNVRNNLNNILAERNIVNNQPNYEPFLQSKIDPNFNFPESSEHIGTGIRKMKGYVCNIEKEELEKKRRDFWSSRFEGNVDAWALLENLCTNKEFTDDEVNEFLVASELRPYKDCINVVYDPAGTLYEIPNYCIHDPIRYDVHKYNVPVPTAEKHLELRLRHGVEEFRVNVSNMMEICELKALVAREKKVNHEGEVKQERIRLFYFGRELKNSDKIFMHEIQNEAMIVLFYKEDPL